MNKLTQLQLDDILLLNLERNKDLWSDESNTPIFCRELKGNHAAAFQAATKSSTSAVSLSSLISISVSRWSSVRLLWLSVITFLSLLFVFEVGIETLLLDA